MVVSDNGDLELYAVHDTPKQAPWSARGDLAIGAGRSYKLINGFRDDEPVPEPWDLPTSQHHATRTESLARSDRTREESVIRGRSRHFLGDEEAFAVLGDSATAAPTNLAASRPGKSRTYSPASFRNYHYEHSAEPVAAHVDAKAPLRTGNVDQLARGHRDTSRARSRRSAREKSASRVPKDTRGIHRLVEEDISMIMRDRVIRGYGLSNVCGHTLLTIYGLTVVATVASTQHARHTG